MAPLTRTRRRPAGAVVAVGVAGLLALGLAMVTAAPGGPGAGPPAPVRAAGGDDVSILLGEPSTLDPAAQGDVGSAAYTAQLFETLTAFDPDLTLRPALARSWDVAADGHRVVFHLRQGLTFSDGSPISGDDVVRSWLRVIDPERPSPLASLLDEVRGAEAYRSGRLVDPAGVGIAADRLDVLVDLERPGADLPAIVAAPAFGIVPPGIDEPGALEPDGFVGSGGYVLQDVTAEEITLAANARYWAGEPAIATIHALTTIGGRSPVAAFEDGDVDYTGIGASDAAWLRYDAVLGPQLRVVPSLSLVYLGFDASEPPFDEVRVRQAFGSAVDWRRIVELGAAGGAGPATSLVPPGIPGAPGGDWLPAHGPDAARALLADAGFRAGRGFPEVVFAPLGSPYAEAIAADLERELGVRVSIEQWDDHFGRLHVEPPGMFAVGWVADYPGPNDFLGILLRTGSTNDYGRWSSAEFDAAVDAALSVADPVAAEAAWTDVLEIVRRDVPAVPLAFGSGWALSRDGLLGAGQNGLGLIRMAGLAWDEP